jgi:flagellar protein FlaF
MAYPPNQNPYAAGAAYANTPAQGNPRQTEAWALTEAARRLAAAARGEKSEMRTALRLNWRLWTILQAEIIGSGDNLPDGLRGDMLSLAQFVDKHTLSILADPEPSQIEVLISINRSIAAGQSTEPASAAEEQTAGFVPSSVAQSA